MNKIKIYFNREIANKYSDIYYSNTNANKLR